MFEGARKKLAEFYEDLRQWSLVHYLLETAIAGTVSLIVGAIAKMGVIQHLLLWFCTLMAIICGTVLWRQRTSKDADDSGVSEDDTPIQTPNVYAEHLKIMQGFIDEAPDKGGKRKAAEWRDKVVTFLRATIPGYEKEFLKETDQMDQERGQWKPAVQKGVVYLQAISTFFHRARKETVSPEQRVIPRTPRDVWNEILVEMVRQWSYGHHWLQYLDNARGNPDEFEKCQRGITEWSSFSENRLQQFRPDLADYLRQTAIDSSSWDALKNSLSRRLQNLHDLISRGLHL